ncbi:hypothetical protein [Streptomyces sp. NPDC057107]|uniref:hypothetical protein n=1 Tax=Streptomyces sp. NPDC057107 TaxID=3346021 RepID=UPI00362AFA84
MTTGGADEQERIRTAVAAHARRRAWREAETAISAVLADPEVQRLRALIEQEETRAGRGGGMRSVCRSAQGVIASPGLAGMCRSIGP